MFRNVGVGRIALLSLCFVCLSISAQETYFPTRSFGVSMSQDDLLRGWFSSQLHAMREPSLWTERTNASEQTYRFTWLRSFQHPISVRVEVQADGTSELTAKETAGAGGYKPGSLIIDKTVKLSAAQTHEVQQKLEAMHFWTLPTEGLKQSGTDGAEWVIEGVRAGNYHVIHRWSPATGPVRDFGLFLVQTLAGLQVAAHDSY